MTFGKCLKIVDNRALSGNDFKRLFEAALNKIPSKNGKITIGYDYFNEKNFI